MWERCKNFCLEWTSVFLRILCFKAKFNLLMLESKVILGVDCYLFYDCLIYFMIFLISCVSILMLLVLSLSCISLKLSHFKLLLLGCSKECSFWTNMEEQKGEQREITRNVPFLWCCSCWCWGKLAAARVSFGAIMFPFIFAKFLFKADWCYGLSAERLWRSKGSYIAICLYWGILFQMLLGRLNHLLTSSNKVVILGTAYTFWHPCNWKLYVTTEKILGVSFWSKKLGLYSGFKFKKEKKHFLKYY